MLRSADGSHWDNGTVVLTVPAHQIVSPSTVRGAPHAPWIMWAVNAGPQGCSATSTTVDRRTSTDGLNWSAPIVTDLSQPGQVIWHIDVEWIPARSEYWAIYNTYPTGGKLLDALALCGSQRRRRTHWTASPSPIARSGVTADFADIIYRSTFMVNSKGTRGRSLDVGREIPWTAPDMSGRTAVVSTTTTELFAIAGAPASAFQSMRYRDLPPPEP